MSPISKPQLLLYLQLSQIESVYQVAQNPDIMALILSELEPMWNYNSVVKEFQDPRFHRHTKRLQNDINKQVHCGRIYLRVIYPKPNHYWYWIQRFKCENINLYGMIINTGKRWQGPFHPTPEYGFPVCLPAPFVPRIESCAPTPTPCDRRNPSAVASCSDVACWPLLRVQLLSRGECGRALRTMHAYVFSTYTGAGGSGRSSRVGPADARQMDT